MPAQAEPKPLPLTPRMRDYLASWPVGEERHDDIYGQNQPGLPAVEKGLVWALERAVAHGYLRMTQTLTGTYSNTKQVYARTDKPCKRYEKKPRTQPYEGVFPWPADEHWQAMEVAPARIGTLIAARMSAVATDDRREALRKARKAIKDRNPIERAQNPFILTSKSELAHVRQYLLAIFQGEALSKEAKRRLAYGYLPTRLGVLVGTGIGLRLLFLDILCEPVYEHGKFTRFRAIDGQAAFEEIERIGGKGDCPAAKYLDYMHHRPQILL